MFQSVFFGACRRGFGGEIEAEVRVERGIGGGVIASGILPVKCTILDMDEWRGGCETDGAQGRCERP